MVTGGGATIAAGLKRRNEKRAREALEAEARKEWEAMENKPQQGFYEWFEKDYGKPQRPS